MPLLLQVVQLVLIHIVAGNNLQGICQARNPIHLLHIPKQLPRLLRVVSEISRVKTDTDRLIPQLDHRHAACQKVAYTARHGVVRIDEGEERPRKRLTIGHIGRQLPLVGGSVAELRHVVLHESHKVFAHAPPGELDRASRQVVERAEGLHERVRVGARDLDTKHVACHQVRRPVEPSYVRVSRGAEPPIHPLRAAQPHLEEGLGGAHRDTHARRVGGNERRVVDHAQKRRLEKLANADRSLDPQQRLSREHHCALAEGEDLDL
mmetsp:Transcript_23100/g.44853  ORF Transcript_23100/g.44853 Transcript_23100/m.44853 type:complete len:264 (-) Transcript_23100:421-1212(-)